MEETKGIKAPIQRGNFRLLQGDWHKEFGLLVGAGYRKMLRLQYEEKELFRPKKIIDNPIEQSSIIDIALSE